MKEWCLTGLLLSGCSAIFMERVPDTHRPGQPVHCTASKGWMAWDGVLAAAHGIGAIATGAVAVSSDDPSPVLFGFAAIDIVFAVGHLVSANAGSDWADQCESARTAETSTIAVPTRPAPVPRPPERRTVYGQRPLFCASTSESVGLCFLDEAACSRELEKSGAPSCERRSAGSCFNARRALDGEKQTVCAVSIKDCEARREAIASDPDYDNVTRCGIYRMK